MIIIVKVNGDHQLTSNQNKENRMPIFITRETVIQAPLQIPWAL